MARGLSAFVFAVCVMSTSFAHAATYYTSLSGSDSRTCQQAQSATTPKGSLAGGLSCLAAGDTLLVRAGTYNEAINNNVPSGTSWTNKVRVAAYTGETVWVAPQAGVGNGYVVAFEGNQQYIELDGLNIDASKQPYAGVKIEASSQSNPHHIRVQNAEVRGNPNATSFGVIVVAPVANATGAHEFINLTVHGGGMDDFNHGFYIQASNVVVDHCLIYDWPGAGIQIENNYALPPANVVLRNNTIRDLRSTVSGARHWGVIVAGYPTNSMIYNNIIYNVPNNGGSSAGILVYQGRDTQIYNNTLYGGGSEGIVLEPASSNARVVNNISTGHGAGDFRNSGSATVQSNNFFGGNPLFVNTSAGNFQLQLQSPAINAGTTVGLVATDVAGTSRPQQGAYDIGAYEVGTAASTAAATYHVAQSGSDSNSCQQAQSTATPKRSIGGGLSCLTAGDTLLVRGGTYNEAINNNVPSGTSWSKKVRVAAYPGETVWVAPQAGVGNGYVVAFERNEQYIELDGLNLDASKQPYAAVKIETQSLSLNPHHIRVQNAELRGNPNATSFGIIVVSPVANAIGADEFVNLSIHGGGVDDFNHGIYIQASDVVVDHCDIYDWPGAGIQIENNYGLPPANVVLRNNTIRNLRSTGSGQRHWGVIVAGHATSTSIYNNIIHNIPNNGGSSSGILIYQGRDTTIYNNTLYGGGSEGLALEYASVNAVVVNNISAGHGGPDFRDQGTATSQSNNMFGGSPLFVNAATGNFQLQTQSPAINKGTAISKVSSDIVGTARPQQGAYDLGAYELVAPQNGPPAPASNVRVF